MADEIIRLGDKTSHGGTVIEGSQRDICMGKPIAYMGHMTFCPQCKGGFPIVEGVASATFYGRGVAVAGMKTACGAVLIASQFTDRVHRRSSSSGAKPVDTTAPVGTAAVSAAGAEDDLETEHFYRLVDGDGNHIDAYRYDVRAADKLHAKGAAYTSGETVTIKGDASTQLVTWLGRDGGLRS